MLSFIRKNYLALVICFFAITGFFAAFTLSVEKIELIKDTSYVASCNFNATFSCTTVMKTPFAELFGFPNSLIGVAGYPMAIVTGLFLIQNRKMNKFLTWFTTTLTFLAFCISYYWLYISAFVLAVFCPWCLVSTTSATCIFFALMTIHLFENNFGLPEKHHAYFERKIKAHWNWVLTAVWFIGVIIFAYFPFFINRL